MNPIKRYQASTSKQVLNENGVFLLEFSLVAPLLLLFLLGAYRVNEYVKDKERLEFFSREAVKAVFHSCRALAETPGSTQQSLDDCVDSNSQPIFAMGLQGQSDYTMIVTLYGPGGSIRSRITHADPGNTQTELKQSRFTASTIPTSFPTALSLNEPVFSVESAQSDQGVFSNLFNFGFSDVQYGAALL